MAPVWQAQSDARFESKRLGVIPNESSGCNANKHDNGRLASVVVGGAPPRQLSPGAVLAQSSSVTMSIVVTRTNRPQLFMFDTVPAMFDY